MDGYGERDDDVDVFRMRPGDSSDDEDQASQKSSSEDDTWRAIPLPDHL